MAPLQRRRGCAASWRPVLLRLRGADYRIARQLVCLSAGCFDRGYAGSGCGGRARPRPGAARHQQVAAAHRGPRAGAPVASGVQREAGRAAADAPRARQPGGAPPAPARRRLLSARVLCVRVRDGDGNRLELVALSRSTLSATRRSASTPARRGVSVSWRSIARRHCTQLGRAP